MEGKKKKRPKKKGGKKKKRKKEGKLETLPLFSPVQSFAVNCHTFQRVKAAGEKKKKQFVILVIIIIIVASVHAQEPLF